MSDLYYLHGGMIEGESVDIRKKLTCHFVICSGCAVAVALVSGCDDETPHISSFLVITVFMPTNSHPHLLPSDRDERQRS